MKKLIYLAFVLTFPLHASVVGISTHPLNDNGRVLSAEMTGYMSERNEMGAGLRYTQEVSRERIFDLAVGGGQDSRGLMVGTGLDLELLDEGLSQPRVSFKPYLQYQRFDRTTSSMLGGAPTLRKGFSVNGQEFFPYLAMPTGMKIDSVTDEFVYYASATFGMSMPFPGGQNERILLSLEGNKDLGSTSDYVGCLVSWVWN